MGYEVGLYSPVILFFGDEETLSYNEVSNGTAVILLKAAPAYDTSNYSLSLLSGSVRIIQKHTEAR